MKFDNIKGIIPPIITPLHENGKVDEEGLRKLVNYCIESGLHGIFAAGSGGETMSLLQRQRFQVIKIVLEEASDRVPVLCGAIDASTERVIENIKMIEQYGAKVAVVTPPFYIRNSCQNEIIRHFEKIAAATEMKLLVYNIPANTNVTILPDTLSILSDLNNIIGLKDSSDHWPQFQKSLFLRKTKDFKIFQGLPEYGAVSILMGADGLTPLYSLLLPNLYLKLYESSCQQDISAAFGIQKVISAFYGVHKLGKSPVSIQKFCVSLTGLTGGKATEPCEPLSIQEENAIRKFVEPYIETDRQLKGADNKDIPEIVGRNRAIS